jgi:hypothetical protein
LAALAGWLADVDVRRRMVLQAPFLAKQIENSFARAERQTEFLEVLVGQQPQRRQVDLVLFKKLRIAFEPLGLEPLRERGCQHGRACM